MLAGIDEAGRGPVLGPLVMAVVAIQPEQEEQLRKLGVKDSKLLTPETRELLYEQLIEFCSYDIISAEPSEVDRAVNGKREGDSLNKLEARTTALLINNILKQHPVKKIIIDSPTKDGGKYETVVRDALKQLGVKEKLELQCEIKADLNYLVVGAASILAKVTRDRTMRSLEQEFGEIGSGYITDPKTHEFVMKNWQEGHDFFRKSWETYKRLVRDNGQSSLAQFAEQHQEQIAAFEVLKEEGFMFEEPKNQYEVVRMKRDKNTVIKYTTGKLVIQGPEKEVVEELLKKKGL